MLKKRRVPYKKKKKNMKNRKIRKHRDYSCQKVSLPFKNPMRKESCVTSGCNVQGWRIGSFIWPWGVISLLSEIKTSLSQFLQGGRHYA